MINKNNPDNFIWPEFNDDRERIKAYSKKYKNMSIAEAFADVYGIKLEGVKESVNDVPKSLSVGDVLNLEILNVSKNRVDFDTLNYKQQIITNANLFKYDRFKKFLPKDPVKVKVTSVQKDKVIVDPFMPLVDEWLQPIIDNPTIQKVLAGEKPIKVKNLQLSNGGFIGDAVIPSVSEFVGEDFTIKAFIPGSQIVLNITNDFSQFVGKTVDAFVLNYMLRPGTADMSLICSVKELIKFRGERGMMSMFNEWCGETDEWKKIADTTYIGKVTGVINSSKKCGVFVEIPELMVTGMIAMSPDQLVNYKPHDNINVKLTGFDEEKYYNPFTKQMQHVDPYVVVDGVLEKCNIKPILAIA